MSTPQSISLDRQEQMWMFGRPPLRLILIKERHEPWTLSLAYTAVSQQCKSMQPQQILYLMHQLLFQITVLKLLQ